MQLIYEGKAKKIFSTDNPDEVIMYFKDEATAFNAQKKGVILNKGILNNKISTTIFDFLKTHDIPTHLIDTIDERTQRCRKVDIVPLEVIVRNVLAGSTARLLGVEEGTPLSQPVFEICYKKDELGDPLINDSHAIALGLATREELDTIYSLTAQINTLLIDLFKKMNIRLVDFKIEFGRDSEGNIVLADEISPDSCRLWDLDTNEKLDKDRFRRDLGNVEEAYQEILNRIQGIV